ncbi:K02A2.6-like [Cordylochernes scorpioides]|uniref:K02A2.6-like n=1 Tax=Cordylochernes scorpioides TaxID=51811 RepID=A0ABY6KJ71_9ARAC|nr:K02A2.6-like [Cordylochernes scorpioides]
MSRLPQGCKISSNVFQREMHRILSGLLGKNYQSFIDDVLIYSESLEQHLADLPEVFDRLRKYGLQERPSKCQLFQEEVTFSGHRVDKDGIHPKENNIEKIKDMSPPKNTLSCTRYEWNETAQRAYDKLKSYLSSAPILIHPDYREKFLIFTDASGIGCGGMLSQLKNGTPLPISFYSHKFRGAELNYSTIEKECLAIIMAIEQFDYYIYGQQVEIYCDH